ncbi:sigma-54-dependent Fis family transcriptional regulator [Noviherbaspirillum sedimenti]|uniref:AAA family ATPase n=1 Tax=Noviherbaspirillum sedimenti TaxID=2320865 RepID=A0A3A3G3S1_9BURK|nr:sigma-54-dependent Fis family transcriptional regulator [Noviherbaspirillum sedimenti]RJG02494.1 AAA family ATPase [Noviherbaspirillum sedimenti]
MKLTGLIERLNLRSRLRFDPENGEIWLHENRMFLLHAQAFGALRKELFDSLGVERARGLLVRMGFESGKKDAELAKRIVGDNALEDVFLLGAEMHMLEGMVKVRAVDSKINLEQGAYHGEFIWEYSSEAEAHIQQFGIGNEHACWTQIGYASGYATAFTNKLVIFREMECKACGAANCRIVGKLAEDWDDPDYLCYFRPDNIQGELTELREEVAQLRETLSSEKMPGSLIGVSDGFRKAFNLVSKAAPSAISVLLLGETGVGKERFARWLHDNGPRADKPFVAINCAAIPHDLIESELFGVTKGAYTGADQSRPGRFERANGGTLFLDEVGEMSLAAQVKLLRVLQTGEVERLGDNRVFQVDVRLVAATNVNLQDAIAAGRFRADLYYRLATYPITIPPLRERRADLPLLINSLIEKHSTRYHKKVRGITDRALLMLSQYSWPGNIRELENVIERGVLLVSAGGYIEVDDLFAQIEQLQREGQEIASDGHLHGKSDVRTPDDYEQLLSDGFDLNAHEDSLLKFAVDKANGNLTHAARLLGITRRQLSYRLSKRPESAGE